MSRHIKNIFESQELPISVVAENATTGPDGKLYLVKYYNLDMIISVGSSLKDCGKKLTTINKLETINIDDIIHNL